MPTPTKGARLGGSAAHQRLILANLATQLFEHGRIVTTEAKAKRLRPLAEKLITKAKRGDIHCAASGAHDRPGQGCGAHAVHRDRAQPGRPRGRLHPDHQGWSAQGRQRSDGIDRVGQGIGRGEQEGERQERCSGEEGSRQEGGGQVSSGGRCPLRRRQPAAAR